MITDTGAVMVDVKGVHKSFTLRDQTVEILKGIDTTIRMSDFVVILGPSGCGKSTLLHIVLGLEKPSSGTVMFLGEDIYNNTDEDYRSSFRKKHIGMVYQQANWVKSLNVWQNVGFPLILLGMEEEIAQQKAIECLKLVDMQDWADRVPTELSSGQQQRVALARSLINNPEIIIADEPTGNLDFASGEAMMELLYGFNQEKKKTVVMVTHDLEYVKYANTVVQMLDGQVVGEYRGDEKNDLMKGLKLKRKVSTAEIDKIENGVKNEHNKSFTLEPTPVVENPASIVTNTQNPVAAEVNNAGTQPISGIRVLSKT